MRTRRRGCFGGCFGCLGQVALICVAGIVILMAGEWVFMPWSYYLGGSFHWYPEWHGWGKITTRKAGEFDLYVSFWPFSGRFTGNVSVTGVGLLCTPKGERFRLHLGGNFISKHVGRDTNGEPFRLYMDNWGHLKSTFSGDLRPELSLWGEWRNPNLVMNDHGTLSQAFTADGSVNRGPLGVYGQDVDSVVFRPESKASFEAACKAVSSVPHPLRSVPGRVQSD